MYVEMSYTTPINKELDMRKNNICAFLCGILASTLVFGVIITASAAFGNISFNKVNLVSDGKQIFEKGSSFELASGQKVPSSILYEDELGGGTTYLPVRNIAELFDVSITWDSETGTISIGEKHISTDAEKFLQDLAEQWLINGDYPKNIKGETYGPELLFDVVGYMPDLISTTASNGQDGYLRNSELEKFLASPDAQNNSLPVYDLNGNVIGEFVFENGPSVS